MLVNENACRITGYTREEMLSLSPKDLDDPEEWDKALDITQKIMDRGYLVFERTLVRKDGKKVPIEISTHVFRLNHQDMMHSIFRDITERRAAEDAIRLANQKLNLLSGITRHDINNQLTILVGYLSLLEKTQHDLIFDKYLGKVRTAAGRISALIQFTKDYEQLGLNTPVWQEIEKISKMAAVDLLPASINLIVNTGQYEVFADPMFMLVLYNLFENANRHGVHATEIAMNFIEEGNKGRLIIEDNGIGVPLALKEKIFEKGFGSNTGFGLYLSREILPITGLSIVETGIEGKGARFEINLPPGTWRRGPG
jgi:PAS domain S-box-containing protein